MFITMKRNLIKIFLTSFVLCTFASTYAFAAPNITSTSGIIEHGGTITITGNGFGNKNPAKPIIWADFEDGSINPSSLGQRNSWSANENLVISSFNQTNNSNYDVVGEWNSALSKRSFSFWVDKNYWTKIYHYQKKYFDFDITANQKFWRLWPEAGTNNFLAACLSGTGRCYNEDEGYSGGVIGSYQGSPSVKNQWHIEEFIWQHSGGTGENTDGSIRWVDPNDHSKGFYSGIWDYTQNGIRIQHRENVNNKEAIHQQLRTDNFTDSNHLPPDGSKVYMDNIYIDDTYARVMVGNQGTFDASIHREIQIPSAWSDTSITITINQGTLSNLNDVYLYVFDENGIVNSNGYLLSSSPDSPPPPPAPSMNPVVP